MADEKLRDLERKARAGDQLAFIELVAMRERLGPTVAEVEYLQEYLKICERFINGQINLETAQGPYVRKGEALANTSELGRLNEEYSYFVRGSILKHNVMATVLANASDDGWAVSDICW